jgi:hypothetical protein
VKTGRACRAWSVTVEGLELYQLEASRSNSKSKAARERLNLLANASRRSKGNKSCGAGSAHATRRSYSQGKLQSFIRAATSSLLSSLRVDDVCGRGSSASCCADSSARFSHRGQEVAGHCQVEFERATGEKEAARQGTRSPFLPSVLCPALMLCVCF